MSKVGMVSDARVSQWDLYGTEQEDSWMRTVIEYSLRPWKFAFGLRT
ncbi:MAG: hypothetical protein ACFFAS_09965 [Promethearchaeota archaeon]